MIIPAADLSEQISTAGMEASGTGNMKLALNGALTIGTLDGANIEIRDHVGAENIAIFGMEAGDVMVRRKQGLDATDVIRRSPRLSRAINAIESGVFSPDDPARFASIGHALRYLDHYMVGADFDSYYDAQRGIDARWQVVPAWTRASILNVARMPWFSSDRTIREYAEDIWNVPLQLVGELVAAAGEELDAVVGHGVVAGGEHHAEVGAERAGEIRHRRRGQHADAQHVHARAGQARRPRRPPGTPRTRADPARPPPPAGGPRRCPPRRARAPPRPRGRAPAQPSDPRWRHRAHRPCRRVVPLVSSEMQAAVCGSLPEHSTP